MELFVIIWQQKLCLFLICFLFMNVSICLLSLVDISCKYVYDYVSMMVKVCLFLVVTRLWLLSVFLYSRSSKVLMAVLGSSLLCYNKLDYRKNLKLIDGVLQLSIVKRFFWTGNSSEAWMFFFKKKNFPILVCTRVLCSFYMFVMFFRI